jgi:hypothetical protein
MDNGQQAGNGVSKTACSVTPVPDGAIAEICEAFGNDKHRMLDILREVQDRFRCISPWTMDKIASHTGLTRIEVEGCRELLLLPVTGPKGPDHDPAVRRYRRPLCRTGSRHSRFRRCARGQDWRNIRRWGRFP